VRAR